MMMLLLWIPAILVIVNLSYVTGDVEPPPPTKIIPASPGCNCTSLDARLSSCEKGLSSCEKDKISNEHLLGLTATEATQLHHDLTELNQTLTDANNDLSKWTEDKALLIQSRKELKDATLMKSLLLKRIEHFQEENATLVKCEEEKEERRTINEKYQNLTQEYAILKTVNDALAVQLNNMQKINGAQSEKPTLPTGKSQPPTAHITAKSSTLTSSTATLPVLSNVIAPNENQAGDASSKSKESPASADDAASTTTKPPDYFIMYAVMVIALIIPLIIFIYFRREIIGYCKNMMHKDDGPSREDRKKYKPVEQIEDLNDAMAIQERVRAKIY